MMSYLEEVRQNTPMGRIIGSGCANAAKVLGISRVPAVKGQALPYHAARPLKGYGTTYATSTQGADHTAGSVEMDMDFNLDERKVDICRAAQINMAFLIRRACACLPPLLTGRINLWGSLTQCLMRIDRGDLLETGKEVRAERALTINRVWARTGCQIGFAASPCRRQMPSSMSRRKNWTSSTTSNLPGTLNVKGGGGWRR